MLDDDLSSIHPGKVLHKLIFFLTLICLILSACAPASGLTPTGTEAVRVVATLMFTPAPQSTGTLPPSPTHQAKATAVRQPTITISPEQPTSLPTIPTFTPTFDVQANVTATPAPRAECPKENPKLIPDFPYCDSNGCADGPYDEATLNYLNAGGTLEKLEQKRWGIIKDFTGDGLKEVAFPNYGSLYIFGCKDGKYQTLLKADGTQNTPSLENSGDLNGDAIPDLIVSNYERRAFHSFQIFEWKGNEFSSILENKFTDDQGNEITYDWVGGTGFNFKIIGTAQKGIKEIVAVDKIPYDPGDLAKGLPWRDRTVTIAWNGKNFVIKNDELGPPQYRFQALQDADAATLLGKYEKAINLYQLTIFNNKLDWWSKERKTYETYNSLNSFFASEFQQFTPTPYPTLPIVTPDESEYPRLAAYAYFRMIILHTFLSENDAAQIKYTSLLEKFPASSQGYLYAEMASAFLDTYNSTGRMVDACGVAIQFAAKHPEILIPLGSDYHGWQSHKYVPADVCPFR